MINIRVILETVCGSRLYGTSLPDSDWDYRGVCLIPLRDMVDPFQGFEQYEGESGEDRVLYHIRKFFDLAASGNPNILEILFATDDFITRCTPEGGLLLRNSILFVSKKVVKTFTGYASAQLKRMERHKRWLETENFDKPHRKEFGLYYEMLGI